MKTENIEDIYELSPTQQGMFFHSLLLDRPELYFEQFCCSLGGELNIWSFQQAWQRVTERHSVLRTSFHLEELDKPLQLVHRQVELPWEVQDWREFPPVEQQERLVAFLQAEQERGFDLSQAPLMRFALIRVSDEIFQFIWSHHHLLLDGWSLPVLLNEVFALYCAFSQGNDLKLKPSRPYRDYITWLHEQDSAEAESFWREALRNVTGSPPLIIAGALKNMADGHEHVSEQQIKISAETTVALQSLAQRHQLTLNDILQGAWALLLSRYSGKDDVILGATVSGRPDSLTDVESMVGLFINTLPVRVQVLPDIPIVSWLKGLHDSFIETRNYGHASLGQIQEWSEVPVGLSLFESLLVFENYPLGQTSLEQGGLKVTDAHVVGARTNYPLTIIVEPGAELLLRLICDPRRFEAYTIGHVLHQFKALLECIVASPEQKLSNLPLLQKQRITITSIVRAEPLEEVLAFWMRVVDIPAKIEFLCKKISPGEVSAPGLPPENDAGINITLLQLKDLLELTGRLEGNLEPSRAYPQIAEKIRKFVLALNRIENRPHLVCVCPDSPEIVDDPNYSLLFKRFEELLASELNEISDVHLITYSDLLATYPAAAYYDTDDESGQACLTPAFFAALGTLIARGVYALQSAPHDALVPDYTEDLWGSESCDVEQILRMVRAKKGALLKPRTTFLQPRTPIEKGLAEIWAEFLDLDLEDVSINDNFFDLGGHSLMATQLVSRVREIFQIEVPLKLLFTTIFTIEALAMTIEQHLIEQVSAAEVAEMLAELDGLSEEEVKGMLA